MMRLFTLYLRSRHMPAAAAALVLGTAAIWTLRWAVDATGGLADSLAVFAAALGVAAATPGLAGADPVLDRTAAIAWPPRRTAHVMLAAAAVAGALVATTLTGSALAPAWLLVRDTAGLGGLAALGAATLGAQRAGFLPLTAALLAVPFGAASQPRYLEVLTWVLQPPGTASATITATVLAVSGTVLYAALGARQ